MISAERVRAILEEIRKLPYLTLYVGDWLKDPVAGCSLAAQMLWMRMMFVMHDAPIYGHMVDAKGRPIEESRIVRLCGVRSVAEYRRSLTELQAAGVPRETGGDDYAMLFVASVNGSDVDLSPMQVLTEGVIYSRRMVKDQRLRVIRRLAGELGTPNRKTLVPQTSEIRGTKQARHAGARAGARSETDNDNDLDSSPSLLKHEKEENPPKQKAASESRRFSDDSDEMEASRYLFDKMLVNNPSAKPPNFQAWAAEFDRIFRIDKREYNEVLDVVDWCQEDSFWRSNILSPATLRKQYDKLNLQRQDPRRSGAGPAKEKKRIFLPGPPLTPRT